MKNKKRVVLSLLLCTALLFSQPMGIVYAAENDGNRENTDSLTTIVQANENEKESNAEIADSNHEETNSIEEKTEDSAGSVEVKPEQPVEVKPEQPVEVKPEQPVEVKPEQPVEVKPEQPVEVKPEQPTDSNQKITESEKKDSNNEDLTTGKTSETTSSAVETETTTNSALITEELAKELLIEPLLLEAQTGPVKISKYDVNSSYDASKQYYIEDAEDMRMLAKLVNGEAKNTTGDSITVDFSGAVIKVSASAIDLSGEAWKPIGGKGFGRSIKTFKGTLEGNNVVISGMSIDGDSGKNQGLFGSATNATFNDITVKGAIKFNGCNVGGIVACANNCVFQNCINDITITGNSKFTGGIVGLSRTSNFNNCYNLANITGEQDIGGILGKSNSQDEIKNCKNKGNITGSAYNIGGIIGECVADSKISISINNGNISGSQLIGGIAGYLENGKIENCYATGTVTATDSDKGGIIGASSANVTIEKSFYYNESTPLKISGSNEGTIKNCFFLEASEYGTSYGGEAKSIDTILYNEVIYILNGGSSHENVWEQGKLYPQLAQGAAQAIYRICISPFALESNAKIKFVEGSSSNIINNPSGGQNLFLKNGEKFTFELQGTGELVVNANPNDACQQAGSQYTVTVNNSDINILYGQKEELDKPTVNWYAPELTEYNIGTEKELIGFYKLVNGETAYGPVDFFGKTIKLTESITLKEPWQPIGTTTAGFAGVFDGNGKSISGLSCGTEATPIEAGYQGLFGNNTGTIQNLTVSGNVFSNGDYVGGIVGHNEGIIENCTFESGSVSGKDYVGGIAGYNVNSECKALKNAAVISGENYVGGIFGKSESSIGIAGSNCANTGKVTAKNNYAGGITGYATDRINYVENSGQISGNNYIGGIVGYSENNIFSIQSKGIVTGKEYIGGIAGYVTGIINGEAGKETFSGKVKGENNVGGIAGYAENNIDTVLIAKDSTISGLNLVGGIVGDFWGSSIANFIIIGSIDGTTSGAIVGNC